MLIDVYHIMTKNYVGNLSTAVISIVAAIIVWVIIRRYFRGKYPSAPVDINPVEVASHKVQAKSELEDVAPKEKAESKSEMTDRNGTSALAQPLTTEEDKLGSSDFLSEEPKPKSAGTPQINADGQDHLPKPTYLRSFSEAPPNKRDRSEEIDPKVAEEALKSHFEKLVSGIDDPTGQLAVPLFAKRVISSEILNKAMLPTITKYHKNVEIMFAVISRVTVHPEALHVFLDTLEADSVLLHDSQPLWDTYCDMKGKKAPEIFKSQSHLPSSDLPASSNLVLGADSCGEQLNSDLLLSDQPFGLTFDPFKNDDDSSEAQKDKLLSPQEQLLHQVGQKTSEITAKEDQMAKLQLEIRKQQKQIEDQVRGHVDQMQHFLNAIQELESHVSSEDSHTAMSESGQQIEEQLAHPVSEQYGSEIQQLQIQMELLSSEYQGREACYLEQLQQYEDSLKTMARETEGYRVEVEQLHRALSSMPQSLTDEDFYPMNKRPHGVCLIINNCHFHHEDPERCVSDRGGSEIDVYNLTQTFRYLQYSVEVHENLTSSQMNEIMLQMASRDHSQYDSFVCFIMTQGERDTVYGTDSQAVVVNDLTGVIKMCSTLREKPKLFFIQACRGEAESKGFERDEKLNASTENAVQHDGPGIEAYKETIPVEADFFYGFATPLGYAAYRSRRHGSWYISELCQVLVNNVYTHTLGSMMKKVHKRVSRAYTKDGYKQCPEVIDRLRFDVHFFHFLNFRKNSV